VVLAGEHDFGVAGCLIADITKRHCTSQQSMKLSKQDLWHYGQLRLANGRYLESKTKCVVSFSD
jgi:hypothetical protein